MFFVSSEKIIPSFFITDEVPSVKYQRKILSYN